MSKETEYLLQIYRDLKTLFIAKDFKKVEQYILERKHSKDKHVLRTLLVATKAFKEHPLLKDHIEEIVSILEERTGKKIY